MKKSMLRRLIANQLLVVALFAMLTAANVVWQFGRDGEGEIDKQMLLTAQGLLNAVEPLHKEPEVMQRSLNVLANFTRSQFTESRRNHSFDATRYEVVVRLLDASGAPLFQSPPDVRLPADSFKPEIRSFDLNQQHWHSRTVRSDRTGLQIQFAETDEGTVSDLASILFTYVALPTLMFMPFAGFVTWAVSRRGLSPLRSLADMIAHRTPHDLQALGRVEHFDETAPVVTEINALLERLRATLARERDFLADAAHELRTPLAVVQAQAHVMQHAAHEAQKKQAAHELDAGVSRAAELINKLLVTARLSGDDFSPRLESLDLTALVQERVALLSTLAARKQIEMELKARSRVEVRVDRETFVSAVDNVIDNAIRYTPNGGSIVIEIAKEDDARISLRVADNGVGIPQELHERVFERFYRVNSSEQLGSGLGLAIVKRVLALHGGGVSLSTGLNQRGLAVAMTLPGGLRSVGG
jgi:signal transduction histidine kinase